MNESKAKKYLNKLQYIVLGILSGIIITSLLFLYYLIFIGQVTFSLIGNNNVEVDVFTEYKDEGVKGTHCTLNRCIDLKKYIKMNNEVKTDIVGTYEIKYTLKYKHKTYILSRKVKVVDKVKPEIALNGNKEANVCPGKEYQEEGYKATDNYDGDITDKVQINKEHDIINYIVKDSSENENSTTRNLKYTDIEKPQLSLYGKQTSYINVGTNYKDPGYIATDNCDGNITTNVKTTNNINTNKPGTYKVSYEIKDAAGNTNSITRTVVVTGIDKTNSNSYLSSLNTYIKQKGYKVSIGYYNLNTGYKYTYNPSAVYYGASLIKTVDALYIYENANNGKIDLDTKIPYAVQYKRGYSLGMQKYRPGEWVSLRELVNYDISVSDNTAHAILVNHIGFNTLKQYGNSLGGKYTLTGGDIYGLTNVDDQIAYMRKLYNYTNSSSNGKELRNYFINGYYNYISFSGLPTFAHKYGYSNPVFHDVGIVYDSKPYIIVILSNGYYANRKDIFQDLSKKIYEYHKTFQ